MYNKFLYWLSKNIPRPKHKHKPTIENNTITRYPSPPTIEAFRHIGIMLIIWCNYILGSVFFLLFQVIWERFQPLKEDVMYAMYPLNWTDHGPLTRYVNCGFRMRRECWERITCHQLQRKPLVSDPGMHHGTCVAHVPWCMSGFANPRWRGKRSRHSRCMRSPQFYVSGKRPNSYDLR